MVRRIPSYIVDHSRATFDPARRSSGRAGLACEEVKDSSAGAHVLGVTRTLAYTGLTGRLDIPRRAFCSGWNIVNSG